MLDFQTVAASLVALLLGLTLHEFAHALMGHYLGDTTAQEAGRLSVNPFVHIDPVNTLALPLLLILAGSPIVFAAAKPVPFNPWRLRYGRWGAAMVAAAGPVTNLLLAIIFGLYLRFVPMGPTIGQFFYIIVVTNVSLFVFNLIPFPPLDGSRVLYAAVPIQIREVMDRIESIGFMAIVIFMVAYYYLGIGHLFSVLVFRIVQLIVPVPGF
ncbi:site-2 protease family protein [Candidatus Saccharibacteria bacterium]|nr:site-2 protease family protein [Candidatus Saccharibacteria bacterium]